MPLLNIKNTSSDKKKKIIEQCFPLLLRKGYDGVSISDIQSTLGISRGLLYHYFGSKEALFLETTKYHFTTAFQIDLDLIADYNIDQMIDYIVDKYQKFSDEILQGVPIINYDFLYYRAMQESAELAILYQRVRDDELHGWAVALKNTQMHRGVCNDIDPKKLARHFVYIIDGIWMQAVTPMASIDLIKSLKDALETFRLLIKEH